MNFAKNTIYTTYAWYSFTLKPDVKYLQNRSVIPHNRKGVTAFAVFLLSLFVSGQDKPASGVRCRSPPVSLNFHSKIQIGGKGRGVQSRTGRKEMAALERSRGKDFKEVWC